MLWTFAALALGAPQYAVIGAGADVSRAAGGPVVAVTRSPVPVEVLAADGAGWRVRTVAGDGHCYPAAHDALSVDLWVADAAFAPVLTTAQHHEIDRGAVDVLPGVVVKPFLEAARMYEVTDGGLTVRLVLPADAIGTRYPAPGARPVAPPAAGSVLRANEDLLQGEGFAVYGAARAAVRTDLPGWTFAMERACLTATTRAPWSLDYEAGAGAPGVEPATWVVPAGAAVQWTDGGSAGTAVADLRVTAATVDASGCWIPTLRGLRPANSDALGVCVAPAAARPPAPAEPVTVHWTEVERKRLVQPEFPGGKGVPDQATCKLAVTIDASGVPTAVEPVSCEEPFLGAARAAALQSRWYPYRVGTAHVPARFELTFKFQRK